MKVKIKVIGTPEDIQALLKRPEERVIDIQEISPTELLVIADEKYVTQTKNDLVILLSLGLGIYLNPSEYTIL